ncbi:NADAR family protein [Mucilaginibacter sp.]
MIEIKFYKVEEPYGVFSNFSPSPIILTSEIWPTAEHFFQANKFLNFEVRDRIKAMKSPMDAAKEGRNRNNILRDDWEQIKDTVMYKAVKAKFLQHPDMKSILLDTGTLPIIEHTANDNYWADGGDGSGGNMLGIILMRVREELSLISPEPDMIFPPWIAFPSVDQADMFWRMGLGENYLLKLNTYMTKYGREEYVTKFPEPEEWRSFYR